MSSIDTRVVEMKFNNSQFEAGVKQTQASLKALNESLKLQGASKGLSDVANSAKGFNLGHISDGIDALASKFKMLSIVGITALTNIVNKAVDAGARLLKSLTIDPITQGLHEYETTLNSVQTILANTGLKGQAGLAQVNAALLELNEYSDKTIYNFSEMAKNIGTFTAAGVALKPATAAIKGIANLAAISGSSSDQASSAMYQLSQAMATGTVKLMDWNSVVNAGMGGKVFQQSLIETAKAHGVAVDKIIKKQGSFRESLSEGWLTSSILTETLSKFTGDLTAAQLKSMGYNAEQIKQILELGKTAQDAATKVKTMSQLIGTLQEAVGSGWAQTWQIIFGDFGEAKTLFTGINDVVGGFIQKSSEARNKVLGDWKALGGRTVIITAISNAFHGLMGVINPIKDAFREIFPPTTGKQLYEASVAILNFTKGLKIGADTADRLKRTFAGVFAVFDIAKRIVGGALGVFKDLFASAGSGSGGFLKITAAVGDWLVRLDEAIKKGEGLKNFFKGLSAILQLPIKAISAIVGAIGDLVTGVGKLGSGSGGRAIDKFKERFAGLGSVGALISKAFSAISGTISRLITLLGPVGKKLGDIFGKLVTGISDSLANADWSQVLSTINTGLFAGFYLMFKKFMGSFGKQSPGQGIVDKIKGIFDGVTNTLKAMQASLKANVLIKIALAIGILTASVVALSMIDSAKLTKALIAIATMFLELGLAMKFFSGTVDMKDAAKLSVIAAGMILLAIAVDILSVAVKNLSELDWEGLAKGLGGLGVLLGMLVGVSRTMSKNAGGMIRGGASLILMATAIRILVSSVTDLSGLSWGDLAKGLTGVAVLLTALGLYSTFADTSAGGIASGAGLILLAAGIKILASAVKDLSKLSWGDMAKGLVGVGAGLAIVALAIGLLPPTSVISAAGIFVVSLALGAISDAMKNMGNMDWESIAKGIIAMAAALTLISLAIGLLPPTSLLSAAAIFVAAAALGMIADALGQMGKMNWEDIGKSLVLLAGALTIITVAMIGMTEALPGAAALIVVAAALNILAPVLKAFGDMSWSEIGKGLLMLAGVFLIFGVAGALLTPVIPTLLGLGAAIALIGAGVALAGAGLFLLGLGLTAIAASGALAMGAIRGIVTMLLGMLPLLAKQLGLAIVAFAEVIATSGPAILQALTTVLGAMLDAVIVLAPKFGEAFRVLLDQAIITWNRYMPKIIDAGIRFVLAFLKGVNDNIGKIATMAVSICVNFLNAIAAQMGKITSAGATLVVKFVNGVADSIRANSGALGAAGANLGEAIVQGMVTGIGGGISQVTTAAGNLAAKAINAAKGVLGISSPSKAFEAIGRFAVDGFVKGLKSSPEQIQKVFTSMAYQLRDLMTSSAKAVATYTARLRSLNAARKKDSAAIREAQLNLAQARLEQVKSTAAYYQLTRSMEAQKKTLVSLSKQHAVLATKLADANKALVDAKKVRDDYAASISDQFDNLPTIAADTKLSDFVTELQSQIDDTKTFVAALQKLRDLGLSDKMYRELLAKGPAALPFINELLASGKIGVESINNLSGALDKVAEDLGSSAGIALYQAGVDAAAGLVRGLASQQAAIDKQMNVIAASMLAAIKKTLGIKSPSKAFAEIGRQSAEGVAAGIDAYSSAAAKAAEGLGVDTVMALQKTISGMSDLIGEEMDLNPTITPVLDLSAVKDQAGKIGDILPQGQISVNSAYQMANDASAAYSAYKAAMASATTPGGEPVAPVQFIQNNTSPKALSTAEIYRQTKNQISVAKGALTT